MKILNDFLESSFWHERVSVVPLCVYRIGFGLLLCAEALTWLPYSKELFSNDGFHVGPLSSLAPAPIFAKLLCLILVLSCFAIAVGWRTRISLVVTLCLWTFFFYLDHINEKALHSIVIVNLIILLFSACSARLSLDDILNHRKKMPRDSAETSVFALRLLQIQMVQVYFFSGLIKIANDSWTHGEALKQIYSSRWATDLGVWVSSWVPDMGFYALSVCVILFELLGSLLLFVPKLRGYLIFFGILFHTATFFTLYVGYLALHYILALIVLFMNPTVLARWAKVMFEKAGYPFDART